MRIKPKRFPPNSQQEIERLIRGAGGRMVINHGDCSCCPRDERVQSKFFGIHRPMKDGRFIGDDELRKDVLLPELFIA